MFFFWWGGAGAGPWKNLQILTYVFEWLYCTHVSFFSINHLFCLYAQISVFSNIDEVLSINLPANVFIFGDFNIHHRNWLTYSGGTDRLPQMHLLRWLNLLLRSLTMTLTVMLFWISFFWGYYLFCNGFPSIVKFWSCCYLRIHWLSIKLKTGCPISLHSLWPFSC